MTEKSVVDIPIGSVVLAKPKRKNIKHISPAGVNISTDELTNRKLRRLIQGFDPNRVTADQNLLDGEVF